MRLFILWLQNYINIIILGRLKDLLQTFLCYINNFILTINGL